MAYISEADLVPGQSQSVLNRLSCPVCTDLFKDPVIAGGICQHVFCRGCLLQATQARANCPLCERGLDGAVLEPSLIIRGFLDDLVVKCVYDGCPWTGSFGARQAHVRSCPNGPSHQELQELERSLQATTDELRELDARRTALAQEQGHLERRRAQVQQALGQGTAAPPREEVQVAGLTRPAAQAAVPTFQWTGRQPQVAPPDRYASLSQAERDQNNQQLVEAARHGNVAEVSRLLNEGLVDVNGQDSNGWTALHVASGNGHANVVERLLQASQYGYVNVVELLLQAGANPNQTDNRRQTPLSVACVMNNAAAQSEMERLLCQAGGR